MIVTVTYTDTDQINEMVKWFRDRWLPLPEMKLTHYQSRTYSIGDNGQEAVMNTMSPYQVLELIQVSFDDPELAIQFKLTFS